MYGFKLEGGGVNGLKRVFANFFSLEWNSFEKTWFRIQFAKNTKQFSTTPEKQYVVSQKNNRLFILVNKYKLKWKSLRDREIAHTVYTGSLLNQGLHPVFPETTGNPLSNQT